MGLFKESIQSYQHQFLKDLGFEFGIKSGPRGEYGYTKIIYHNENERLWITVDDKSNKLYLYNELDCGGMLWDRIINIPKDVLNNKDEFIDWLDNEI